MNELQNWLNNPDRDYAAGVAIFAQHCKNKALVRYFQTGTARFRLIPSTKLRHYYLNGRDAFCFAVRMPEEEPTPRMATANPIPLLLEGVAEGRGSDADVTAKPHLNEEKRSLQQVPEVHPSSTYRLLPNPNHGRFTMESLIPSTKLRHYYN